ncbi:hypothetical protein SAMN05192574_10140 [Mucilaginibacter gossypiicola]|uniref:Uncharacterized protein n=1 Tax=Mucilaginibacter gossypiicola TaxID=551995 RepID=A0A1H7ZH47_9SPHI|nr:hypothetical protein SAMN05192574_10140 [Mucilaginibacter gossypiicola]
MNFYFLENDDSQERRHLFVCLYPDIFSFRYIFTIFDKFRNKKHIFSVKQEQLITFLRKTTEYTTTNNYFTAKSIIFLEILK